MGIEYREYMKRDENGEYSVKLAPGHRRSFEASASDMADAGDATEAAPGTSARVPSGLGRWFYQQVATFQFAFLFGWLAWLRLEGLASATPIEPAIVEWGKAASTGAIVASMLLFGLYVLIGGREIAAYVGSCKRFDWLAIRVFGGGLVLLDACLVELAVAHERDWDAIASQLLDWGVPALGFVALLWHRPVLLFNLGSDGFVAIDAKVYREDRVPLNLLAVLAAAGVLAVAVPGIQRFETVQHELPALLAIGGVLTIAVRCALQFILPGQSIPTFRYLKLWMWGILQGGLCIAVVVALMNYWRFLDGLPNDWRWTMATAFLCFGLGWAMARFGSYEFHLVRPRFCAGVIRYCRAAVSSRTPDWQIIETVKKNQVSHVSAQSIIDGIRDWMNAPREGFFERLRHWDYVDFGIGVTVMVAALLFGRQRFDAITHGRGWETLCSAVLLGGVMALESLVELCRMAWNPASAWMKDLRCRVIPTQPYWHYRRFR